MNVNAEEEVRLKGSNYKEEKDADENMAES